MRLFVLNAAAILLVVAAFTAVHADGEKVPLDQVPAAVVKAVKERFPKAKIALVEKKENPKGRVFYEVALKEGDRELEPAFTAEGKLLWTEEAIKEADLPAVVKKAFRETYPDAKVEAVQKATTGEGDAVKVSYEIHIATAKDRREVGFDAKGKLLEEIIKKPKKPRKP